MTSRIAGRHVLILVAAAALAVVAVIAIRDGRDERNGRDQRNHPCAGDADDTKFSHEVTETGGNMLALGRSKGWFHPGLGAGKWIGTATNKGPGPSKAFPMLEEDEGGCVKFKYPGGTKTETAWLHEIGAGAPVALKVALYCVHGKNHPSDIKPRYEGLPDVCEKVVYSIATSIGRVVDSLDFDPGVRTATDRMAAVTTSLTAAGVSREEMASFAAQLESFGPWYPCASAGCCRAWGT